MRELEILLGIVGGLCMIIVAMYQLAEIGLTRKSIGKFCGRKK